MAVVWLASVPVHNLRGGTRRFLTLPRLPWFEDHLRVHNVECSWENTWSVRNRTVGDVSIIGLVKLRAGLAYDGLLTPWSRESYLQHQFYECPLDAFSAVILEAFVLADALVVYERLDDRARVHAMQLMRESALYLPVGFTDALVGGKMGRLAARDGNGTSMSVRDVLARWGCGFDLYMTTAVQPLAQLVMKKGWSELVFVARWKYALTLMQDFPPDWMQEVLGEHEKLDALGVFDVSQFANLIAHLRRRTPRIMAGCTDDEEMAGERLLL